jgi:hypothetical protein
MCRASTTIKANRRSGGADAASSSTASPLQTSQGLSNSVTPSSSSPLRLSPASLPVSVPSDTAPVSSLSPRPSSPPSSHRASPSSSNSPPSSSDHKGQPKPTNDMSSVVLPGNPRMIQRSDLQIHFSLNSFHLPRYHSSASHDSNRDFIPSMWATVYTATPTTMTFATRTTVSGSSFDTTWAVTTSVEVQATTVSHNDANSPQSSASDSTHRSADTY